MPSDTDRTTVTRRRALKSGGLAAIAAGLLGTTAASAGASPLPPAASPSSALSVGITTNMADIVADVQRQIEIVRTHDRAAVDAESALTSALNDDQRRLFTAYEQADAVRDFEQMDLYMLDLGRHLPGLHPAIWALWQHIIESRQGECCMPDADGSDS